MTAVHDLPYGLSCCYLFCIRANDSVRGFERGHARTIATKTMPMQPGDGDLASNREIMKWQMSSPSSQWLMKALFQHALFQRSPEGSKNKFWHTGGRLI